MKFLFLITFLWTVLLSVWASGSWPFSDLDGKFQIFTTFSWIFRIIHECFYHRDTFTRNLWNSELPSWPKISPALKFCSKKIVQCVTYIQWLCTQDLVNHTVDRILCDEGIIKHISQLKEQYGSVELQFIYKYGLDGSKVAYPHLLNSIEQIFSFKC